MSNGYDEELEDKGVVEIRKDEFRNRYKQERDLVKLAKIMKNVQNTRDRLESELALVNAEFDVLRIEVIPALMEDKEVENFRVEGLGRVSLTGDMYVRVNPGAKSSLFAWLRKRKLGDLIQESLNSSTLKAFVKKRTKEGKELPSELLSVTPFTRASITKG